MTPARGQWSPSNREVQAWGEAWAYGWMDWRGLPPLGVFRRSRGGDGSLHSINWVSVPIQYADSGKIRHGDPLGSRIRPFSAATTHSGEAGPIC